MKKFFKKTPRQMLNENIVESFKKFIKETPNSVLFWNGLLYVIFFSVWIFAGTDWVGLISGLGSLLYLGLFIDDVDDSVDLHYWPPLTFLFWLFIVLLLVLGLFYLIYIFTIEPFNKWLDKPKKEADGSDNSIC